MSVYKGKTVTIQVPAQRVADKFADLSRLQSSFSQLPEDQLKKIGELRLEPQAIVVNNPMAGELRFEIVERTPQRICMVCGHPMQMGMNIDMAPNADDAQATDVTTGVDVDLPFFLKPILGPRMQYVADGFADMVSAIARAEKDSDAANA